MSLRSANEDDAPTVALILISSREAFLTYAKSPHSEQGIRHWVSNILIPSGGVVIAQCDDLDVGVLATSESDGVAWVDQLYVAPGFTGRGVGGELLNHAKGMFEKPIHLWTFQQNVRAQRFYERHGFEAIKQTDGQNNEEKCPDVLYEFKCSKP